MRSAWIIGAFLLFLSLLSSSALAEDHAVLIGAGKYASGKWGLALVDENIRLMEKALVDEVGVSPENIQKIMDRDVRRPGIRRTLLELAHSAKSGDRLFVYYTGHATKVTKQGAPIRAHFTWDTMESFGGEGFDPETLITDIDFKNWLRPLREKSVLVIIIREACFCGGGYAQDISTLSPGKPPTREPIGDIEISACDIDQAAWALDGASTPVALFTSCLAECLSSDAQKITAKNLYDTLRSRVSRKQRNQTPILDLGKGVDPTKVILVDRTLIDLIVDVTDAVTGEPIAGVKVLLTPMGSEKSMRATTPSARFQGLPRQGRVFPWIEKDGYIPKSHVIEVPQRQRALRTSVELSPEVSEVTGRISTAGSGSLSGVSVIYESGSRPLSVRHVDSEVKPRSDGSFCLQVPPRSPCRILVVKGTDTLASMRVNNGNALSPVRCYDPSADEWAGETYDVGTITIDLGTARAAITEAERAFEDYFRRAAEAEESGDLDEALRCFGLARSAAGIVGESSKKRDLSARATKGMERIEANLRSNRYEALVKGARTLLDQGNLDAARIKANEALQIKSDGAMAQILLEDVDSQIAARDRRTTPERESPTAGDRKSGRSVKETEFWGEHIAGFTFLREETFSCGGQTNTVKIYNHEKTGLEFVLVPGGSFMMGSPSGEKGRDDDEGQHHVTVTSFLVCRTECTQAAWDRIGGTDDRKWRGSDLPIENVSWNDVTAWCRKAELRLPTEAEWEYACRAGTEMRFYWGDDPNEREIGEYACYSGNSNSQTHQVGQKKPNAWGLYDMSGNVWEWCSDWYAEYDMDNQTDPKGPAGGSLRVRRGGYWDYSSGLCRSADRSGASPSFRFYYLGFRLVRTVQ